VTSLSLEFDAAKVAALYSRLGKAGASQTLVPPITRSAARLRAALATYPPPSGKRQTFVSERQRRYVMMLVHQGLIPYRRTGNLGRAWVEDIQLTPTGVTGTVGNAVTGLTGQHYGPFVQGSATQSSYFQGSAWPTDQAALDHERDNITRDVLGAIRDALG
jgi:hypothetical protein